METVSMEFANALKALEALIAQLVRLRTHGHTLSSFLGLLCHSEHSLPHNHIERICRKSFSLHILPQAAL